MNAPPVADESTQADATRELDYDAYLELRAGNEAEIEVQLVTCPQCGAQTRLDAGVVADACAFCTTPLVAVAAQSARQIKPKALVSFAVERRKAQDIFVEWIGGRWFAPNALKQTVRRVDGIRGVYLPCWTFDADTQSTYTGQRGVDRIVHDTRRDAQGNSVTVARTVTDWYPASGEVTMHFDDLLVPASNSIPSDLAEALLTWNAQALVPYADDYVAGFTMEAYQLGLEPGFELARAQFGRAIEGTVRQDIGGSHQRVHEVNTRYDAITFKHILLPAWICSYMFGGKSWLVVVNGQNGDVRGHRPWSAWKISGAVLVVAVIAAVLYVLNSP
ncbi:MAG: hypothetical protein ABIW79_10285 [Gemmatimonas sp.]